MQKKMNSMQTKKLTDELPVGAAFQHEAGHIIVIVGYCKGFPAANACVLTVPICNRGMVSDTLPTAYDVNWFIASAYKRVNIEDDGK